MIKMTERFRPNRIVGTLSEGTLPVRSGGRENGLEEYRNERMKKSSDLFSAIYYLLTFPTFESNSFFFKTY